MPDTNSSGGGEVIRLEDLIRFFRRHLLLVFGLAGAFAAAAVAYLALLRPPGYEASATLVVVKQTFKSELKPPVLPVQGYQRLLESDAVIGETIRRLKADGTLESRASLQLGRQIRSRIFVARRAEEKVLAPILEVVARARTAEQAASIANTWAKVFLDRVRLLLSDSLSPLIHLIEEQYEQEGAHLVALEEERSHIVDDYQKRIDEASGSWNRRLVEGRKKTEDLIASFHVESRRLLEKRAAEVEHSITESNRGVGGPGAGYTLDAEVATGLQRVLALRIQLSQTPRLLVLEKAVSDDALWQALVLEETRDLELESVLDRRLLTQLPNPVYDTLELRLAEILLDFVGVTTEDRDRLRRLAADLERLQSERSGGLAKLFADRALASDELERQKARTLDALGRERAMALDRIGRQIDYQRKLFDKLAENYKEAVLARAQEDLQEVRLGAPAVAPERQRAGTLGKALLAAVAGALLGLGIALVREVGSG